MTIIRIQYKKIHRTIFFLSPSLSLPPLLSLTPLFSLPPLLTFFNCYSSSSQCQLLLAAGLPLNFLFRSAGNALRFLAVARKPYSRKMYIGRNQLMLMRPVSANIHGGCTFLFFPHPQGVVPAPPHAVVVIIH
jgi:hypothetical protein